MKKYGRYVPTPDWCKYPAYKARVQRKYSPRRNRNQVGRVCILINILICIYYSFFGLVITLFIHLPLHQMRVEEGVHEEWTGVEWVEGDGWNIPEH